jgi:restriction system protein
VAAIDPEVNADADLSGFTDARIRLLDPALTEWFRTSASLRVRRFRPPDRSLGQE